MKKNFLFLIAGLLLLNSCAVEPKPINYGSDACHSCSMNIVQQKFGAELVTKKGKVYKYDAIECMLRDVLDNWNEEDLAHILAIDYNNPKNFIDATQGFHLKSEKIPSPMGGFLSSYETKELGDKAFEQNGGELMNWSLLKERYTED